MTKTIIKLSQIFKVHTFIKRMYTSESLQCIIDTPLQDLYELMNEVYLKRYLNLILTQHFASSKIGYFVLQWAYSPEGPLGRKTIRELYDYKV